MGYLFLDIETCHPGGENHLSPSDARVVAIAHKRYSDFSIDERTLESKKETSIMREWTDGEEEVLRRFHEFLTLIERDDDYLTLTGFNHTSFDLPFLYERMAAREIAPRRELYETLFSPFKLDLMQITTAMNERFLTEFDRPKLAHMGQKDLLRLLDLPVKERDGHEIPELYDRKEYGEIERYIRQENEYWEEAYLRLAERLEEAKLWEGPPDVTESDV